MFLKELIICNINGTLYGYIQEQKLFILLELFNKYNGYLSLEIIILVYFKGLKKELLDIQLEHREIHTIIQNNHHYRM